MPQLDLINQCSGHHATESELFDCPSCDPLFKTGSTLSYEDVKQALNDLSCELMEAGIYARVVTVFAAYMSLNDFHRLRAEMGIEV